MCESLRDALSTWRCYSRLDERSNALYYGGRMTVGQHRREFLRFPHYTEWPGYFEYVDPSQVNGPRVSMRDIVLRFIREKVTKYGPETYVSSLYKSDHQSNCERHDYEAVYTCGCKSTTGYWTLWIEIPDEVGYYKSQKWFYSKDKRKWYRARTKFGQAKRHRLTVVEQHIQDDFDELDRQLNRHYAELGV